VEPSENPDRGHAGVAERTEASPFQPIRSGSAERSNASWLNRRSSAPTSRSQSNHYPRPIPGTTKGNSP
jgi:hypothetical protein